MQFVYLLVRKVNQKKKVSSNSPYHLISQVIRKYMSQMKMSFKAVLSQ